MDGKKWTGMENCFLSLVLFVIQRKMLIAMNVALVTAKLINENDVVISLILRICYYKKSDIFLNFEFPNEIIDS